MTHLFNFKTLAPGVYRVICRLSTLKYLLVAFDSRQAQNKDVILTSGRGHYVESALIHHFDFMCLFRCLQLLVLVAVSLN